MRLLAVAALAGCAAPAGPLMRHVAVLADPALEGRAAGSPGELRAEDYVIAELGKLGLAATRQPVPAGGANIYALVPGTGAEIIVIGAHLDHLGRRGGVVYPGADDDASGVAVVLGIAERLVARRAELRRSILFVFFTAEEEGLLGSAHFVANLPVPRARIAAMINLDMVGRPLLDQRAFVVPLLLARISRRSIGLLGARHYPGLRALVDAHDDTVAAEDLPDIIGREIEARANGRSDSASFEAVGIPSLFFGDGESSDYHRPTDTIARVDPALLELRARRLAAVAVALSTAAPDAFARSDATPPKRHPRSGPYGVAGVDLALAFEHGTHPAIGGHASLAYVDGDAMWFGGATADVLHFAGTDRYAIGPMIGLGPVGIEVDTVLVHGTRGVAIRPFVTIGTVSLAVRIGSVEGEGWFGDVALSLALPLLLWH